MAGSDEAPEATQWRRTSKFYVRLPGLPWLIGLIAVPLLLAVIGYGELDRTRPGGVADAERTEAVGRRAEHADDSGSSAGSGVNYPQRQRHQALR
jgi:hypothetical protein